ncbi:MAG TPA: biotin carboxylase N-terminal domain-containing protein [Motilibacteraceae bacterium]|nr:biotin carboxylase N-terminal domain-containing protein [Motilibacteraceae bacterium]
MAPIRTLLVANRGEIACRVLRTAHAMGIRTVAVHAEPDAGAPFVHEADVAVPLQGTTLAQTYLDVDQLLAAAQLAGADAVHPGYGFLSENAAFARAVLKAGLTWVGPSPESIEAMALKVEAKRLVAAAGVPLVPGAEIASDDASEWTAAAHGVGYPLLVKASAGGGGRGMRLVEREQELAEAVAGARREAASSFGDPTVFLERALRGARHVEVQVLGDTHGNLVHLWERECSVQRRHQKVVEESPSPGTTPATLERMYAAALAAARAVDYVGTGTVEFLVAGQGEEQEFFFLEMNTRLQVEHPVTEAVTGLDLVRLQLLVAQGEPLPFAQADVRRAGHAVEARVYAEDPARGYLPSTGRLDLVELDPSVRWDAGVRTGGVVSPHYDAMLAKAVAHAPTRGEALAVLARALDRTRIHGVTTNLSGLASLLRSHEVVSGATTTDLVDARPDLMAPEPPDDLLAVHLAAAVLVGRHRRRASAGALGFAPGGWSNVPFPLQRAVFDVEGRAVEVRHRVDGRSAEVRLDGLGSEPRALHVTVREVSDHHVDLEAGLRHRITIESYESSEDETRPVRWWTDGGGLRAVLVERPRFSAASGESAAAGPSTPVPGTVTAVQVAPGDVVAEGDLLVVVEAMKMEHRITADLAGTVAEVRASVGQAVDAHEVLVVLEAAP